MCSGCLLCGKSGLRGEDDGYGTAYSAGGGSGGSSCPCCCCCGCFGGGKRGATILYALVGLLLSTAIIVPPVYVHETDGDYAKLFPLVDCAKDLLRKMGRTDGPPPIPTGPLLVADVRNAVGGESVDPRGPDDDGPPGRRSAAPGYHDDDDDDETRGNTYKLAIFQFLEDTERASPYLAFGAFCIGCVNVPLDLLLLGGACFRQPCGLLPWLIVTFVELLVLGVPLIVFSGLLSLYLAAQMELYAAAGTLVGSVVAAFLLAFGSWCTVLSCYHEFVGGGPLDPEFGGYDALCQHHHHHHHQQQGVDRRDPLAGGGYQHHPGRSQQQEAGPGQQNRMQSGQNSSGWRNGVVNKYYPPHQSSRRLPPVPP